MKAIQQVHSHTRYTPIYNIRRRACNAYIFIFIHVVKNKNARIRRKEI